MQKAEVCICGGRMVKNGIKNGKQQYLCRECGKQTTFPLNKED
jgi:transposase-like protein